MSGNIEDLEKKSSAYLAKVLPGFKYAKGMNKEEVLARLSGNQKARAELAFNVLESVSENKSLIPYMENVEKAVEGKNFDDNFDTRKAEQKSFQDSLILDISKDEVNNNIISKNKLQDLIRLRMLV